MILNIFTRPELIVEKKTKRGTADVDIIPMIHSIDVQSVESGHIVIRSRALAQDPSLPPAQLISALVQHIPELAPDFVRFRRLEVYDKDNKVFR